MKLIRSVLLIAVAFSFFSLGTVRAEEFTLEASVDRSELPIGESLTLTVTVSQRLSGAGTARGIGVPRIPALKGLDVVSQKSSQNMNMVNGEGWVQVQTVAELMPQEPGDVTIPALTMTGADGKSQSTPPITVKVLPAAASAGSPSESELAPSASAGEEARSGISLGKGLLIVGSIVLLVVLLPFGISWMMAGRVSPTTRWEAPPAPLLQKKSEEKVPVKAMKEPSSFDFSTEVTRLKRENPDVNLSLFRRFFEVFHQALLMGTSSIDPAQTPEEIVQMLEKLATGAAREKIHRLGGEWEMVTFAGVVPNRSFSAVQQDAEEFLLTLRRQEFSL